MFTSTEPARLDVRVTVIVTLTTAVLSSASQATAALLHEVSSLKGTGWPNFMATVTASPLESVKSMTSPELAVGIAVGVADVAGAT
jgi:hypothetical protein